uniref:Uncharacterized protein n=1 Tax=Anopheles culicifacies TaxID=139723 RepID=A0A182M323_9DIPT
MQKHKGLPYDLLLLSSVFDFCCCLDDGNGELLADIRVQGSEGTYTRQLVLLLLFALFKQSLNFLARSVPPPPPPFADAVDFIVGASFPVSMSNRTEDPLLPVSSSYSSLGDNFTEMISFSSETIIEC